MSRQNPSAGRVVMRPTHLKAAQDPMGALLVKQRPDVVFGGRRVTGVYQSAERIADPEAIDLLLGSCSALGDANDDDLVFELRYLETLLAKHPFEVKTLVSQLGEVGEAIRAEVLPTRRIDLSALRTRRKRLSTVASRASAAMLMVVGGMSMMPVEAQAASADSAVFQVAMAPIVRVVDAASGHGVAGVLIKSMDEKLLGVTDASGQATLSKDYAETDLLSLEKDGYQMYLLDRSQLSGRNIVSMKPIAQASGNRAAGASHGPAAPKVDAPKPPQVHQPVAPKVDHDDHDDHEAAHAPKPVAPKAAAPKVAAPKVDHGHEDAHAPKAAAPKVTAPKVAAPKADHGHEDAQAPKLAAPKAAAPKADHGHEVAHAPKAAAPKVDHGHEVAHAPKAAAPKADHGHEVAHAPKAAAPKADHGHEVAHAPKLAAPKVDHGHEAAHEAPKAAEGHGEHAKPAPEAHIASPEEHGASHHDHDDMASAPRKEATVSAAAGGVYRVRSGDTLSAIAARHLGNANKWRLLASANRGVVRNPHFIQIGQKLVLPAMTSDAAMAKASHGDSTAYVVKSGDTLSSIAAEHLGDAMQWRRLYQANRQTVRNPRFIFPGQRLNLPQ